MNIPTIPSASLYRFKSVFGFILILLSLLVGSLLIIDYNHKSIEINNEIENINQDIENTTAELEKIKNQAIPICELNKCKCIDDKGSLVSPIFEKGPPLINRKHKELKELYNAYERLSKTIIGKNTKIESRISLLDNYWRFGCGFFFISIITLVIGIIFLLTGFRDWRNKIQRYQDAIIEAQAKKLNSNIQQIIPRRRRKLG